MLLQVSEAIDNQPTLRPDPTSWAGLLRRHFAGIGPPHRTLRVQLGLPTDRPIVMAGHQAVLWHPGILAKYLAADALARRVGGSAAWLVVDQDTDDPFAVRYPTRTADGRLGVATTPSRGTGAGHVRAVPDAPIGQQRPGVIDPGDPSAPPAIDCVRDGLARIAGALGAYAEETSGARQVAGALGDLLEPLIPRSPTVFATGLAGTDLFAHLLSRMQEDPRACAYAYNGAVDRHPDAGLRPLVFDDANTRYELPLWRLEPGKPRRRVMADDVHGGRPTELAPKALLMTGLLRAGACDLFIHGTGGELYDRATEDWLSAWAPEMALCPGAVATATLHLPLLGPGTPTAPQIARARWLAHRARHDPGLLNDQAAGMHKRELVASISAQPRHSPERLRLYHAMHEGLGRAREMHAADLERLARDAERLTGLAADAAIAADRTWAFPLYPPEVLSRLRDAVRAAVGA